MSDATDISIVLGMLFLFGYLRATTDMRGSWRAVATRFAGLAPGPGVVVRDTRVAMGQTGTLARVIVADFGMAIEPRFLGALFLASVVIPWHAVKAVRLHWVLFVPVKSLLVDVEPPTTVYVSRRVWAVAKSYLSCAPVEWVNPIARAREYLTELRARYE